MDIIPFTRDHLNEVFDLNLKVQPNPWSLENFEAELQIKESYSLVILDKKTHRPIGYLISRINPDSCELLSIGVSDLSQRLGLGGKLLNLLKDLVAKEGRDIFLEVNETNLKAKRFYEKSGFQIVQKRQNYYKNGDACLVMKLYVAKRN